MIIVAVNFTCAQHKRNNNNEERRGKLTFAKKQLVAFRRHRWASHRLASATRKHQMISRRRIRLPDLNPWHSNGGRRRTKRKSSRTSGVGRWKSKVESEDRKAAEIEGSLRNIIRPVGRFRGSQAREAVACSLQLAVQVKWSRACRGHLLL